MDSRIALMTKKSEKLAPGTVYRVPDIYPQPPGQYQRGMPNSTLTNSRKNCQGDRGYQLKEGKRKVVISIMFQNMVSIGNAQDQPSQHKLDTL